MACIVSLACDQVQRIVLGLSRLTDSVSTITLCAIFDRRAAPARIGTVVPRVHASVLHKYYVVRVSEPGGINLYRTTTDKFCLILTAIAAKRIVKVIYTVSVFIIKSRQIISAVANLQKIYLKNRCTQCILR